MQCPRYTSYFNDEGAPSSLPLIGYLSRENYNETFALYGSVRDNVFYYENDQKLRMPICVAGDRVLYTGDQVVIQNRPGTWRVTLYLR